MFLQTGLGRASTLQLGQPPVGGDWVLPRYSRRPHCPTPISRNFSERFSKIQVYHTQKFSWVCGRLKVGLTRISSQLPVSDLGEWRHICHCFRWQTIWRVTFVTFLGRMWRSRTQIFFCNLWRFLSHPSRKTSHFGPAGTKLFETGRNVTIRLGLKHSDVFPSQICHLSRKREAGRPFGLRPTLRVDLTRISSQLPVSHLGEWRHICHCFRWQKMWRVTFVTFLGRMWRSRTRKYFF